MGSNIGVGAVWRVAVGTGAVTAVDSGVGSRLDPGVGSGGGSTEGLAPGAGSVAGAAGSAFEVGTVVGAVVSPIVSGVGPVVGGRSGAGVKVGTAQAIDKPITKTVKPPAINSLMPGRRFRFELVWEARSRWFRIRIVTISFACRHWVLMVALALREEALSPV